MHYTGIIITSTVLCNEGLETDVMRFLDTDFIVYGLLRGPHHIQCESLQAGSRLISDLNCRLRCDREV